MAQLTFYFDRCFGRRFPEALWRAIPPFAVEFHHSPKNRFPHNVPDDEWLARVGKQGWIAFSHDRKWHDEVPAASAIKQYSVGCFYLWGAEDSTWDKLRFFVRHHSKIMDLALKTDRPFIYHIGKTGRAERVQLP